MENNPYAEAMRNRGLLETTVNPYAKAMENRGLLKTETASNPYATAMESRGLLKPKTETYFSTPSAELKRDTSGQLTLDLPQATSAPLRVAGGALKAVEGVATLPGQVYEATGFEIGGRKFNVLDAFGWEKAGVVSDWLGKNIPEIDPKNMPEEILQTLVQFVPAGLSGAKLGSHLAKTASGFKKVVAPILGSAVTDALVITPDDKTLLNIADSPLGKRAETFTEGMVLGHLMEGAAKGFRLVKGKFWGAKYAAKKALTKVVDDPAKVAKEISDKVESEIPLTSGMLTDDIGIKAMESDFRSTSLNYVKRQTLIREKVSEMISDIARGKGGDPEEAASLFKSTYDDYISTGKKNLADAEVAIKANTAETEDFINDLVIRAPDRGDASAVIDEVTHKALKQRNQKKNFLFGNIDPDGKLIITDKKPWQELARKTIKATSAGDMSVKELPKPLTDTFRKMVNSERPLTYRALMDFRPSVVNEISVGRKTMSQPALGRLSSIRKAIDGYADELADGFANTEQGRRAAIARDFFKDEYVPEFRQLTGKQFSIKTKTEPWAASATGGKFLKNPSGFEESSLQLRTIVENSPDKEKGMSAIRDFFMADVGKLIGDQKGSRAITKIKSYLNTPGIKESLKAYPEVRKEINGLLKHLGGLDIKGNELQDIYNASKEGFKQTERELNNSAIKFFVNKTPIKAVNSILKSGTPETGMKELVELASKDKSGSALVGLKDAYGQAIQQNVLTTTKAGDVLDVSQAKLVKMLDDPDALSALKVLYSPKEINGLQTMRNVLDSFDSVARKGDVAPKMTTLGIENARIAFASIYGIVKGKGLFMVSNWISKAIGINPLQKVQMLMEDAFLNPKTMKMLLTEVHNEKEAQILRNQFRSYFKKVAVVEARHFTDKDEISEIPSQINEYVTQAE